VAVALKVELVDAEPETLTNLGQLYQYDFAEFVPAEVDDTGRFTFIRMDGYTSEMFDRFVIQADGRTAGFVIVSEGSAFRDQAERVRWIDEFFVLRPYRRKGVGRRAATTLFDTFPGRWEIGQLQANLPAQNFWRTVIGAYTGGRFEEVAFDDDRWQGPVQYFSNVPNA